MSASDAPTDPATRRPTGRADEQRRRLLRAIAVAVDERGFAATTIADIVAHARVSKRTFYEHFSDKLDCFLVAYEAGSSLLLRRLAAAGEETDPSVRWEERLRRAVRAYLDVLADTPAASRTFAVEIQAAGPRALAMRREMHRRTAEQLRVTVEAARRDEPGLRPLSPTMALALVGAMTELVVHRLADGAPEELRGLDREVVFLLRALLTTDAPRPDAASTDPDTPPAGGTTA